MTDLNIISDSPTSDGFNEFDQYTTVLKDTISSVSRESTPLIFGIMGPKYSGKTTLMRILREKIDSLDEYRTLWFNPKFHKEEKAVWQALIKQAINQFGGEKAERLNKIKKISSFLAKESFNYLSPIKLEFDELQEKKDSSEQFYELFRNTIHTYCKDYTLVIFIDGISNCLPDKSIELLEAIKLFLDIQGCVFVMEIDKKHITHGFLMKYNVDKETAGEVVNNYLEKLIQIPFYLKSKSDQEIIEYGKSLLGDNITPAIHDLLIASSLTNPRQIKRFINALTLHIPSLQNKLISKSLNCFISYNRNDREFAEKISSDLIDRGYRVWLDRWEILAGDSITGSIENGLKNMDVFLLIMSPKSMTSTWVKTELGAALNRRITENTIKIIPVLLFDCEIPALLRDYKYVDFRVKYKKAFEELIKGLSKIKKSSC